MNAPKRVNTSKSESIPTLPKSGETPDEARDDVESAPRKKLTAMEAIDDPENPSIAPVEPRCRNCGATFSIEEELVEHAKTCRGGHAPEQAKEHAH